MLVPTLLPLAPTVLLSALAAVLASLAANATATTPAVAAAQPMVVIDLPADPHAPAIATMTSAGHRYRMIIDTGANNMVFHLPVAKRDLQPAASPPDVAATANGLHGQIAPAWFSGAQYRLGDWTFDTAGYPVIAVDLTAAVQAYGIDGLIGTPYLSQLSWHWDNQSRRLLGYPQQAATLAAIRSRMHCEQLYDVNGLPGVAVQIGQDQAVFAIDSGDLGESGNLQTGDIGALVDRGAVRATATVRGHTDVAGHEVGDLQLTQIQGVSLGPTRLDGLVFGQIVNSSRFGRGFLAKFDEVLFDFGSGQFCFPAMARVEPDDMTHWLPR